MANNTFGNFGEFERALRAAHDNDLNSPVTCKCGSTYFEEIKAQQYQAIHNLIIGQAVPPVQDGTVPFVLLRCIKCREFTEPRILRMTTDKIDKKYQDFLDSMEESEGIKTEKI